MQDKSLGRLPGNVAAGGRPEEPAPDYIPAAEPVPEEVWEREAARYSAKRANASTAREDSDTH